MLIFFLIYVLPRDNNFFNMEIPIRLFLDFRPINTHHLSCITLKAARIHTRQIALRDKTIFMHLRKRMSYAQCAFTILPSSR